MFKMYALLSGVICVVAVMLASMSDLAGLFVVSAGLFVACLFGGFMTSPAEKGSSAHEHKGPMSRFMAVGLLIMAAGFGIMPMDGSWFLFLLTGGFSFMFAWFPATAVYDLRSNPNDKVSWKDINHIAVSLGLPILGLSLARYLVETDRSVMSGLVMVVVLAVAGYMLAPRSVVRISQPKPLRRETTA